MEHHQKRSLYLSFGDHYILCIITSSNSISHYLKAVLHPKHCILLYLQVETQFHIQMLFLQAINCALKVYFQDTYGLGKDHTDQRPFSFQSKSQIITSFPTAHNSSPNTKNIPTQKWHHQVKISPALWAKIQGYPSTLTFLAEPKLWCPNALTSHKQFHLLVSYSKHIYLSASRALLTQKKWNSLCNPLLPPMIP
jgi:hypothetical protein